MVILDLSKIGAVDYGIDLFAGWNAQQHEHETDELSVEQEHERAKLA